MYSMDLVLCMNRRCKVATSGPHSGCCLASPPINIVHHHLRLFSAERTFAVDDFEIKATPVNAYYRKTADWLVWRLKTKARRSGSESEPYQAFTFPVPSSQ